jgi:molecular chaperone GrpE
VSTGEESTAGGEPAVDSTDDLLDDELLEAAAVAEGGFADGPPIPAPADVPDPEVLAAERDEYRDTLLRLKAEFDNYRKRAAREEAEVRERAASALVDKLLVVLDACDAAIGHGAPDVEPIAKMLLELLERDGLERMTPEGSAFDPTSHEAVLHEAGDGGEAVVVEVLRTGYVWKGRVLRPAMVKVRG